MYLWLLERDDKNDYDETHGVIVAADHEQEAREIAGKAGRYQPPSVWFLPSTTIRAVGVALPDFDKGIILRDFHAG